MRRKRKTLELQLIQMWFEERCATGRGFFTATSILYADWLQWCGRNFAEPRSQNWFSRALGTRDDIEKGRFKNRTGFFGIGLKPQDALQE